MKRTVTVVGSGRAESAPDLAKLVVTAVASRETMREASAAATDATSRVRAALAAAGIAGADAVTQAVRFEPEWRGDGQPQRFSARQAIAVISRDVAGAGDLVTALVEAGGDEVAIEQLTFAVADEASLEVAARTAAFADARVRASHYAELAGVALGGVVTMTEGGGGGMPVFGAAKMSADASGMAVESGTVAVEAFVTVTWELA